MKIIEFNATNCKNCYKCIRNCDIKSIEFSKDKAKVIHDNCIYCGKCTYICNQDAKEASSELNNVQKLIKDGEKIYASIAPSYVAAFPNISFSQLSLALKKLGFAHVEETAVGATRISEEYRKLIEENKMKNIITTCCPAGVSLVEKYYPELIQDLAPVVSPAVGHGKLLREIYGEDIKVVFIGPCIAKKLEAYDSMVIDDVLMFEEVAKWLEDDNIEIKEDDIEVTEMRRTKSRVYPMPGGIIRTIPREQRGSYRHIAVDGVKRCISVLDSIKDKGISGYFIELSICDGSCIQGPGLVNFNSPYLLSTDSLFLNADNSKVTRKRIPTETAKISYKTEYKNKKIIDDIPDEDTIKELLAQVGKFSEKDFLNCSTCGYDTCRDKAIAVFQGKADLKMCLPYMRDQAESLSNVILENTPNAIFLLDENLKIIEYNRKAKETFKITEVVTGQHIYMLLMPQVFEKIIEDGEPIYDLKGETFIDGLIVRHTIVKTSTGGYLVILADKTKDEENLKRIMQMKEETLNTAQNVIDKQMRVAQEIALLLGETTGETKTALTQLKKSIMQGDTL